MIDLIYATAVEIFLDSQQKLWVNVDGKCLMRIGFCEQVTMDDPIRGFDTVTPEIVK